MVGIILQARMGSTRLPGKIMLPVGDKLLLEHIYWRLSMLAHPLACVLATSDSPRDDVVYDFCRKQYRECFRGSELDVLERYYLCAQKYGMRHIVRLTADNPFVDVEEIDNLIDFYFHTRADFSSSLDSLPVGVGAEIFSFEALEKSFINGKEPHHREHVDEFILENPVHFKITRLSVKKNKNRPDIRLTVDTEEDYKKSCYIVEQAKGQMVTTEQAIELCSRYV